MRFEDRLDGGRRLAAEVAALGLEAPVVLGLPRGGVPVAAEVAAALGGTLDVLVARKVGAPHQPELGIGAVAEGGATVADAHALQLLGVDRDRFDAMADDARAELDRRVGRYRGDRPMTPVTGRDVVLVDDGLATGVTAEAALLALRALAPRRLVLAVPVAAPDTARRLAALADDVVVVHAPEGFAAVGAWYVDFGQTTDDEVLAALERHRGGHRSGADGDLEVPAGATGVIVFAHGSGSGRASPRNRHVAACLRQRRLGTLLVDLVTDAEGDRRFDVELLAERLSAAVSSVEAVGLPVGLFGASTGAAAALVVAADRPDAVAAVVSRGGRTDLADGRLGDVVAPTRLIVGERDAVVVDINQSSLDRLKRTKAADLVIVPGATHLFEEPGALDAVAELAGEWFETHLTSGS